VAHHQISRDEQKQRTRRALLDAALRLLENESLASLSLRALTREVGIVPAAFYRHFRDIPELGVALVAESLGSLRAVLSFGKQSDAGTEQAMLEALALTADYVNTHRGHFRFVARELFGSVPEVRAAIRDELHVFAQELADDLAERPELSAWPRDEVERLSALIVDQMVLTTGHLLDVPVEDEEQTNALIAEAVWRLSLIATARDHWSPAYSAGWSITRP
jgi:AcrR family transcriptional regulator